ncbi:MAG TPA: FeoA family protein [Candidatus Limnocylindrales bacterium]
MSATRPVVPDEHAVPTAPAGPTTRPTLAARSIPATLDRVAVGAEAVIADVVPPHRGELAVEGLLPGRTVRVTGRAPFRGPILVTVGRARLALSRDVAASVIVR